MNRSVFDTEQGRLHGDELPSGMLIDDTAVDQALHTYARIFCRYAEPGFDGQNGGMTPPVKTALDMARMALKLEVEARHMTRMVALLEEMELFRHPWRREDAQEKVDRMFEEMEDERWKP